MPSNCGVVYPVGWERTVRGLAAGLRHLPNANVTYWASRVSGDADDPVSALGGSVLRSPLPSKLLMRAWDRGLLGPPDAYDLVHATSFAIPPRESVPMTAMVHDLGWRHFPDAYPARGRRWHESALARAIERCSKLFVPSQLTADDLIKEGVSANDIVIAPLGCDHLPAENVDAARRALASKGIDGDYMLAVGTLEPRKNLQRLITAYAQAAPNLPTRFPLVIVGPEGWGEALQPQDGVVMFGAPSLDVLAALYARCRLFVSVPLLEGFGLPVLEAMSKGVPVVSSAVPSAGTASYLVDPLDIDEIAAALVRVVTDEQLRAELIANGTKHALRHTWAACAWQHMQQWEALCDDLTG